MIPDHNDKQKWGLLLKKAAQLSRATVVEVRLRKDNTFIDDIIHISYN